MASHRRVPTTVALSLTALVVLQSFLVALPAVPLAAGAEAPVPLDIGENALLRFDFGTRASPVMDGWTQVQGGLLYSRGAGYGWDVPHEEFQNFRQPPEISPFVLQRSWVIQRYRDDMTVDGVRDANAMTFSADLPNGDYRLRVTVGDLFYPRYSMNITAEGEQVAGELAAFHMVSRSIYQLDGRGNWANYGMPLPYWFSVNVSDGRLDVEFWGTDDLFWQRMDAENATAPPHSWSVEMCTGTIRASNGRPPFRYIGGPHTYNSVLGLEIFPARTDLIEEGPRGLVLDPSVTNATVVAAVQAYNEAGNQLEYENLARTVMESVLDHETGQYSDLKALEELLAEMHGDLKADLVPTWLGEREEGLEALLSVDPSDQTVAEMLNSTQRLRTALDLIFRRVETGTNHFHENDKAISILWTFQPGDALYPTARLWMARALYMLDPHRWTSASGTAADVMEDLRPLDPDNPYIRMYRDTNLQDPPQWEQGQRVVTTTGQVDRWRLADPTAGHEEAPAWARVLHEELYWLYDVTDWWVLNRQQPDGALGGGWSDDVEFIGLFGFDALISQGADELSLVGASRFVDGMLASGGVDLERGFSTALADAEHTAEWTGDSLPMMIAADFGNPKWVEFSYKTGVLMRDLWMGETSEGHLHFRSNFLSATSIGGVNTREDAWINYRAALPARWVWWYNGDPELERLFVEWARAWAEDAMRTDDGKPRGVIPASVGFEGDELGGHNSPSWYEAAHPAGTVNYDWSGQQYKDYITDLLAAAYEATGNISFLEPFRLEAELAQAYMRDPVPSPPPGSAAWAGMVLGQGALDRWAALQARFGLAGGGSSGPNGYATEEVVGMLRLGHKYIQKCLPLMTTEASATDRTAFIGIILPFQIYTGGGQGGALLAPKFTYTGLGRDFAACVMDARPTGGRIMMYGFYEGVRDAGVVPWEFQNHGTYSIAVGNDTDGDGEVDDEPDYEGLFTWETKGQVAPFKLEGGVEKLVVIEQVEPGSDTRSLLPDLAITPDDVTVNATNGTLEVLVHNIGAEYPEMYSVHVMDPAADNRTMGAERQWGLPPPQELVPSTKMAQVRLFELPQGPDLVVELSQVRTDMRELRPEITTLNNRVEVRLDISALVPNGRPYYIGPPGGLEIEVEEDANLTVPMALVNLTSLVKDPDGDTIWFHLGSVSMPGFVGLYIEDGVLWLSWLKPNWHYSVHISISARDYGHDGVLWTDDDHLLVNIPLLTLTILPINDPPVYIGPLEGGDHLVFEDQELSEPLHLMDVDGLFRDVDDVRLRYQLRTVPGSEVNVTLELVDGTVQLTWLREDWNGNVTFSISALDDGYDGVPGNVDDGEASTPDHTLVVRPVNDRPYVAAELEPIVLRYGGGPMGVDLGPVFRDVDGDTLYYLVDDSVGQWTSRLSVERASASPKDPNFKLEVTDADWHGDLKVTFVCYDRDPVSSVNRPLSARAVLDVTVEEVPLPNQPPSAPTITVEPTDGRAFEEVTLTATGAVDPEGGQLEYRWDLDGTPLGNWSTANQLITKEIPEGTHDVTVTVRDPEGLTSNATITLDVREPDVPGSQEEASLLPSLLAGLIVLALVVVVAWYISRRPPS